jgi:hypothetical protein
MPDSKTISASTFSLLYCTILLVAVYSCGLKYTPTESPEAFQFRRQQAVETYVQNEINSANLAYTSIAFGTTKTIKPASYKALDSLYNIKYENEKIGRKDPELERLIGNQRVIAQNDTNQVAYIEDHVFTLGKGDTIEFYSALFQLTKNMKIEDVKLQESVFLPKKFRSRYTQFLFEESFLDPGYEAMEEEKMFYRIYKGALTNLSSAEKDGFILHTLKVMTIAAKKNTLNNTTLLKAITSEYFLKNNAISVSENFSEIQEEVKINAAEKKQLIGYSLRYQYTKKSTQNGEPETLSFRVHFDPYLRITDFKKL